MQQLLRRVVLLKKKSIQKLIRYIMKICLLIWENKFGCIESKILFQSGQSEATINHPLLRLIEDCSQQLPAAASINSFEAESQVVVLCLKLCGFKAWSIVGSQTIIKDTGIQTSSNQMSPVNQQQSRGTYLPTCAILASWETIPKHLKDLCAEAKQN